MGLPAFALSVFTQRYCGERMGGESKEDSRQDHSAGAPNETDVHSII